MGFTLTAEEALDEFRAAGALLEGHFILSSGLHSPVFLQKMFVFQDPARTERLCDIAPPRFHCQHGAPQCTVIGAESDGVDVGDGKAHGIRLRIATYTQRRSRCVTFRARGRE